MKKRISPLLFWMLFFAISISARVPEKPLLQPQKIKSMIRADCAPATASIDLAVNNVRVRLRNGGDMWWDGANGRYIVPKVDPGQPEISALYAGGIWVGGIDPGGNLKLAAQTYGSANGKTDFWPGPATGQGDESVCLSWDRFFKVTAMEVAEHRNLFELSQQGGTYTEMQIPNGVKGWPARGNPYFFQTAGFDLPDLVSLASFFDVNGDGNYDPLQGDYPILSVAGCDNAPVPDEMVFWMFNDAGGIHTTSQGDQIGLTISATAFAFATDDFNNDATFYQYRLTNHAIESVDSFFFSIWTDPDLGCPEDDYIASDPDRHLAYVYNEDAIDGNPDCSCFGGINTYCDEVPAVGIDLLDGLHDEMGESKGMSSFMYYNNASLAPPGTEGPSIAIEFYRYMTGSWRDGTLMTYGGNGYNPGPTGNVYFAFPDYPNDQYGWSMCSETLAAGDRRMVISSGPIKLQPGAVNEITSAVVWAASLEYPCPDMGPLLEADDAAQALFDNCFADFSTAINETSPEHSRIQLSPNPFNKNQTGALLQIKGMPTQSSLTVYDLSGQLIRQVNESSLTFDGQSSWWNPDNSLLDQLSSGVYLLRITLPDGSWQHLKWVVIN